MYPNIRGAVTYPNKKLSIEEFVRRSSKIHNNYYSYEKTVYKNYRSKLIITCPVHGDFMQKAKVHLHGKNGCYKCGLARGGIKRANMAIGTRQIYKRVTFEVFVDRSRKIHGDKYIYNREAFFPDIRRAGLICKKHGYFTQTFSGYIYGCKKCAIEKNKRTTADFIKISKRLFPKMLKYSKTRYISNMHKVILTCVKHGNFSIAANDHMRGHLGCSICRESIGENTIRLILEELNIKFIREYKIPGFQYRYDFCIPSKNLLIEYDGIQHFKPIPIFGGEDSFKIIKIRDKAKNKLAKLKKYNLLRISFLDKDIKSTIINYINKINV